LEDGIKDISGADVFVPLWSLRHVPSILNSAGSKGRKLKEAAVVAAFNVINSSWYVAGFYMIKDYYDRF